MAEIIDLIEHIFDNPETRCSENRFTIDQHSAEYSDTKFSPKEHKLWTPSKDGKSRCFLILQKFDDSLRIHHVLEDAKNLLKYRDMSPLSRTFLPSQTVAAKHQGNDQFKGAIEIKLRGINRDILKKKIEQLIIDVTDETVARKLNLRLHQKRVGVGDTQN